MRRRLRRATERCEGAALSSVQRDEAQSRYIVGDDIDWDAKWVKVRLWVELPFWLMVNNDTIEVEHRGCHFPIMVQDDYFELHCDGLADSRSTVIYKGPFKKPHQLSANIQKILEQPELSVLWRKSKTVLKIDSRCNEAVWNAAWRDGEGRPPSHSIYLAELCRAHIPIINQLIQRYRLATYDYFAFEMSAWDVPFWIIERDGQSISCGLVPYRSWDGKPMIYGSQDSPPQTYQLIESGQLASQGHIEGTAGEPELLDALSLMERGDCSGAVRRVTTAIEVALEAKLLSKIEASEGAAAATKFIKMTRMNFQSRLKELEKATGRTLSSPLHAQLSKTRRLRHRIVHDGYRIPPSDIADAQRAVDTGRWIFNWIEDDHDRSNVRERRLALRSLGRDSLRGIFPTEITVEGVVVRPIQFES